MMLQGHIDAEVGWSQQKAVYLAKGSNLLYLCKLLCNSIGNRFFKSQRCKRMQLLGSCWPCLLSFHRPFSLMPCLGATKRFDRTSIRAGSQGAERLGEQLIKGQSNQALLPGVSPGILCQLFSCTTAPAHRTGHAWRTKRPNQANFWDTIAMLL